MKKQSKRLLSLGLSLAVVLMLAGCNTSTQPTTGQEENHSAQATPTTTPTPTPTPTPSPEATPTYYDLSNAAANGFRIEMGTLKGYSGPNCDVFIPEGVLVVADSEDENNFSVNPGIRSVHFPSSIKRIESFTFGQCENLEVVEFVPGEDIVIDGAFNGNDSLSSVTLAEGITEITGFSGCKALTDITFPEGVTMINGFERTGLTEVSFPESTTYIEGFTDCEQLISVTIPNKDTRIWGRDIEGIDEEELLEHSFWTFQNCPNLTIHAPAGGTVEEFASRYNIPFSPL